MPVDVLISLLMNAPFLETLDISDCSFLEPLLCKGISLSKLKKLNLSRTVINDAAFNLLLSHAPSLETLDLSNCQNSLAMALQEIDLSSLSVLNLGDIKMTRGTLFKILTKAPNLTNIRVGMHHKIFRLPDLAAKVMAYFDETPEAFAIPESRKSRNHRLLYQSKDTAEEGGTASSRNMALPPAGSTSIDANTDATKKRSFNLDQIFYGHSKVDDPDVRMYRKQVFDDIAINLHTCDIKAIGTLSNKSDELEFFTKSIKKSEVDTWALYHQNMSLAAQTEGEYYAKLTLDLTSNWQALPSLSANEIMTHYHVDPISETLEIQYSTRDNLYYIKSDREVSVTLDFILKCPAVAAVTLDPKIQAEITACQEFGEKPLQLDGLEYTGNEYLAALQIQKTGACRHRTLVFKAWMDENFPAISARIVNNDCHSFIELFDTQANQWSTFDLGGYDGDLTLNEEFRPEQAETQGHSVLLKGMRSGGSVGFLPDYFPKEAPKAQPKSADEYIQSLLAQHKKAQVLLTDDESVEALSLSLESYCKRNSRACFYIKKPEDLSCMAPFVKRDEKTMIGAMTEGPGGALYNFLIENEGENPLIIVDYRTIHPVKFNSLLDEIRTADSIPIPVNAVIIGLSVPYQANAYDGVDMSSRLDAPAAFCPLEKEAFLQPISIAEKTSEEAVISIELFNTPDWESQLLGRWTLQEANLHFVQGALIEALKTKPTTIELKHAPWENKAFMRFIQETLHSGVIKTLYDEYPLPEGFQFVKSDLYPWAELSTMIDLSSVPPVLPEINLVLNSTLLPNFLSQFICDSDLKTISPSSGLLEESQGTVLTLYISGALNEDEWALFLTACISFNVKINPICAPGITLPSALEKDALIMEKASPLTAEPSVYDYVINSTDPDLTMAQLKSKLKAQSKDHLMLDVSELESSHLLINMKAEFNRKRLSFSFEESKGALITSLEAGKTVVLTGSFKPALVDALEAFILERQQQKTTVKGQLILLPEEQDLFPHLQRFSQSVSGAEKAENLKYKEFEASDYEKMCFSDLQAWDVAGDDEDPWIGMYDLPEASNQSSSEPDVLINERMLAVEKMLEVSPYVFLAGKSGVGKSTFVQGDWQSKYPHFHFGEESINDWARDRSEPESIKTLFIDEANISSKNWREFEGLFNEPPGIMLDHEYIELTPQHKVIFAGNPLSYGGERTLPRLFERHGKSLLFEPLPREFLNQKVLKPVLDKIPDFQYSADQLAEPVLKVSDFLTKIDANEVLISPRELRQMTLSTLAYCQKMPSSDPLAVADYFAYTLSKNLVPERHKQAFEALWETLPFLAQRQVHEETSLSLNASNLAAFNALHDALDVRQLKLNTPSENLGGLGGVIIEGEPGLGKSELVTSVLCSQHFIKASLTAEQAEENRNRFYVLPASASLEVKKKILTQAFHQGAIVVIDEINSTSMMERTLNELLMGTCEGKPPKNPGFLIIGTQNPPTHAGRILASKALQRRLNKVVINEYTSEELVDILVNKGLGEETASEMVWQYDEKKSTQKGLCCRDLIKRAKQKIKAQESLFLVFQLARNMSQEVTSLGTAKNMPFFKRDIEQKDETAKAVEKSMPTGMKKGS